LPRRTGKRVWRVQEAPMLRRLLALIDLPPVWLAVYAAFGWWVGQQWPHALPLGAALGTGLVAGGLMLMAIAVGQMLRWRTTFIPRRDPAVLVTGGVFALSRNPIYLADTLILLGLLLRWDAVLALPLVPGFVALITWRFILNEEARIASRFGEQWRSYAGRTRRWM